MVAGLYVVHRATIDNRPVCRPFVIDLRVDAGQVRGALLRSEESFAAGQVGRLEVAAARDGVLWRMMLPKVRLTPAGAVETEVELLEPGILEQIGPLTGGELHR